MPHNRRGPRHGQRSQRRRRVMRFLQPCLLVMLHGNAAHGYSLLNGLGEFGFEPENLAPSLVYRTLREMEAQGLVTSGWGTNSMGPQRRVYQITPLGERHLAQWMEDLQRMRQEIQAVEAAYQRIQQK